MTGHSMCLLCRLNFNRLLSYMKDVTEVNYKNICSSQPQCVRSVFSALSMYGDIVKLTIGHKDVYI